MLINAPKPLLKWYGFPFGICWHKFCCCLPVVPSGTIWATGTFIWSFSKGRLLEPWWRDIVSTWLPNISQRRLSCHSLIRQFSLVGQKPRNDVSPGDTKPQAGDSWEPWTTFLFPLIYSESWYLTFFQLLKSFHEGRGLEFATSCLNKGFPFERRCRGTFSSALWKGKCLAWALPCHPSLPLQGWNTNTRALGVPGETEWISLLWNEP